MVKYITHVVVHECGLTLGLVPEAATKEGGFEYQGGGKAIVLR